MQLKRDTGWRLSTGKAGERFKLVSFTEKLLRLVLNFYPFYPLKAYVLEKGRCTLPCIAEDFLSQTKTFV